MERPCVNCEKLEEGSTASRMQRDKGKRKSKATSLNIKQRGGGQNISNETLHFPFSSNTLVSDLRKQLAKTVVCGEFLLKCNAESVHLRDHQYLEDLYWRGNVRQLCMYSKDGDFVLGIINIAPETMSLESDGTNIETASEISDSSNYSKPDSLIMELEKHRNRVLELEENDRLKSEKIWDMEQQIVSLQAAISKKDVSLFRKERQFNTRVSQMEREITSLKKTLSERDISLFRKEREFNTLIAKMEKQCQEKEELLIAYEEEKKRWNLKEEFVCGNMGTMCLEKLRAFQDSLVDLNCRLTKQLRIKHDNDFICGICVDARKNVAFQCGHQVCTTCSTQLDVCHICREQINMKITLY